MADPPALGRTPSARATPRRASTAIGERDGDTLRLHEPRSWYRAAISTVSAVSAADEVAVVQALGRAYADLLHAAVRLPAIQHELLTVWDAWIHLPRFRSLHRGSLRIRRDVPPAVGEHLRALHTQVGCPRRTEPWSAAIAEAFASDFAQLPFQGPWLATQVERLIGAAGASTSAELVVAAEAGRRWTETRTVLVEAHLRLVVAIARRVTSPHVPMEDRIQEGNAALTRAIDLFDLGRDTRIGAYVGRVIERAIRTLIRQTPPGPVPPHRRVLAFALTTPPGKGPGHDTGAAARHPRRWPRSTVTISTDVVLGDGLGSLADHLVDPEAPRADDLAILARDGPRVATLVDALAEPARTIVTLYFGLHDQPPETLRDLARRTGLSAQTVNQHLGRGLRDLRRLLAGAPENAKMSSSLKGNTTCPTLSRLVSS